MDIDRMLTEHGLAVYRICRALTKTVFDADDLYQETWLRIFEKQHRYDPERPFENWAARLCLNCYHDMERRKRRMPKAADLGEEGQSFWENLPAPEGQDASELYAALDGLAEKYRTPMVLCFLLGYEQKEAAKLLGVAEGTVKSRISRAKEQIRRNWHEE